MGFFRFEDSVENMGRAVIDIVKTAATDVDHVSEEGTADKKMAIGVFNKRYFLTLSQFDISDLA